MGRCKGNQDTTCLQALNISILYHAGKLLHFAPALAAEGEYPLSQIAKGLWNKVPVIIGGQSCEACNDALYVIYIYIYIYIYI